MTHIYTLETSSRVGLTVDERNFDPVSRGRNANLLFEIPVERNLVIEPRFIRNLDDGVLAVCGGKRQQAFDVFHPVAVDSLKEVDAVLFIDLRQLVVTNIEMPLLIGQSPLVFPEHLLFGKQALQLLLNGFAGAGGQVRGLIFFDR